MFRLLFMAWHLFSLVSTHSLHIPNVLISDVMKHLHVGRCIFLLNLNDVQIMHRMKHVTTKNIFTVAMNEEDLINHLLGENFPSHKEAIVGDFDSFEWASVVAQTYNHAKISKIFWLIFFSGDLRTIQKLRIPYDCEFILIYQRNNGYDLFELYHTKADKVTFMNFATWNITQGLVVASMEPFYRRRYNLRGTQMVMLRYQEELCANDYECAHLDLWFSMGQMMNFTTKMVTQYEAMTQKLEPDVLSAVIVFHANGLLQDPTMLSSMAPIWKFAIYMFVKHESDVNWSAFLRPFDGAVWALLDLTLLTCSVGLIIISYFSNEKRGLASVEYGFAPLDAASNQCGAFIGKHVPKRIAVVVTRLLAVCVNPAYAGMLISSLTLQHPVYPFTDLASFVEDGTYKLGAVNSTFSITYFEYSRNPLSQMITAKLLENLKSMPTNYDQGLRQCCLEKFAFLAYEDVLLEVKSPPCRILKIPKPAFITFAGMHLAANSEFKTVFFHNLVRFQTTGILDKLNNRLEIQELKVSKQNVEVELHQVYTLFSLLYGGIVVSLVILMIERRVKQEPKGGQKHMAKPFLTDYTL